jgi:predicted flap endonuclease-1-like 5' DNA nuclease
VKGSLIGVLFAALLGPAGWVAAGAVIGTAVGMFDKGIKNKLLKELGEKMKPTESAMAVLVERADWAKALESMKAHNFKGEVVVQQIVEKDMEEVEKVLAAKKTVESVPEEMEVPASVVEVAEEAPVVEAAPKPPAAPGAKQVTRLEDLEGVGSAYGKKLEAAGITSVQVLLEKGCDPKGRDEIGKATGISDKLILRWVNMADLYRIKGIGSEWAELVIAAGVDNVLELAQWNPENLLETMKGTNQQKKLVRRLPDLAQVESWVEQAKSLPQVVTYS